jgi:hypothetical protein
MTNRPVDPSAARPPILPIEDTEPTDDPQAPSYEAEIEAERRGTVAEQVEEPEPEAIDDDSEPDAAYRPGTG